MDELVKLREELVKLRVDLISAFNNWQQVRARRDNVEIDALLDVSLKALVLAKKLAED